MYNWIWKLVEGWMLNRATSDLAAEIIEKDPALVVALKKYNEGASFMEFVGSYVEATSNKDDDQIVTDLTVKPFKEVASRLFGSVGRLSIPDGDSDPGNNVTVAEFLGRIVDKVTSEHDL